jgi:aspartyl/asparaginyl beta-hydroxylase (cupin superfamily)
VRRRGIGLCDPLGGLGWAVKWYVESYRQKLKRYEKECLVVSSVIYRGAWFGVAAEGQRVA